MRQTWIALALALTLAGTLTACGGREEDPSGGGAEQTGRRMSSARSWTAELVQDGRYAAGEDGRLARKDSRTEELERELKDMMRGAERAARDAGEKAGDAARDLGKDLEQSLERSTGEKKS